MPAVSILFVEDSEIDMDLCLSRLEAGGWQCHAKRVETEQDFRSAIGGATFDLILADYSLPQFDGRTALTIAQGECPDVPFVFVSGAIGEEVAIDSLHRGATDYVLKHRLGRLVPAVKRALAEAAEKDARRKAEYERANLLISERAARLEAELKAQELARANAELEQFAYAASHDLQEPLRTVRLYAAMLARRSRSRLDEEGLRFLDAIDQGVERMEKLIHDLLSYSQVVHDEDRDFQRINLGALVRQILSEFQQLIEESSADVTVDPLPEVMGEPERLAHVFHNLISNSLKYRHQSAPRIHVWAECKDGKCLISVKDNGIGFEQRHATQIFGLFKRLHRHEYPGTGVGLALAKRIVEQHGGQIWAEGKPGEGALVCFTLAPAAL